MLQHVLIFLDYPHLVLHQTSMYETQMNYHIDKNLVLKIVDIIKFIVNMQIGLLYHSVVELQLLESNMKIIKLHIITSIQKKYYI